MDTTAAVALFARLDRELWLVTAQTGERRGGLIATFVGQASLCPEYPRVVVGISRQHYTWELIEASGAFGLHLLGVDNVAWVEQFGLLTGHETDKFAGRQTELALTGSPILVDALGWLDCSVETKLETGDRTLYLAQVVQGDLAGQGSPLTVRQMMAHLAPGVLARLSYLVDRDSGIDAQAIRDWREEHGIEPLGQQQT
jgi:flavin reductase (DIM6/NTAB) family NADH-FMN oxidoreductase RutF